MKHLIYVLFVITIFSDKSIFAQTSDPYIEFLYDASGNRTSRRVVTLNRSMEFSSDTLEYDRSDSNAMAGVDAGDFRKDTTGGNAAQVNSDNIGGMEIRVYPNPTTGMLRVQITPFNDGLKAEIKLFDFSNKLLFKISCAAEYTAVDLSSYATGTYLMSIAINGKLSSWKIVKE